MGFGVAWIDIFRASKPNFCFGELIGIESDDAEIVERSLMFRL